MYVGGIDLMRAPITLNEHGHGDRYKDHMESSTERYHVVPGHIVLIKQPQCWGGGAGRVPTWIPKRRWGGSCELCY